ncbi:hypothetical protein GIB67_012355 [Kingdonia uniflora]|uniref:Uncharacterized protein n=1 Tax=Kingdonia uniflora TaxID=39325 RepID=A0A7J7MW71_9MAGN|nr:hypothetical protein GIB67_012355 [Kingdonia uniflora]
MGSFNFLFQALILFILINPASILAERSTYIVHMKKSVMPKAFSSHHHWYSAILDSLKIDSDKVSTSIPPKLFYTYNNVINGFSVVLSSEELEALKMMLGCIIAYPDHTLHVDTTYTIDFISLNKAGGLWPASNYGTDAIIGIIDSGVWPESARFGDDGMGEIPRRCKGMCEPRVQYKSSMNNRKLIGARYFNKGVLVQNPNISFVYNSPRDETGHGSYTKSIAAGNYVRGVSYFGYVKSTARGAAPCTRKITWSRGGSLTYDVITSMDQTLAHGVDIISMSTSFRGDLPYEDPISIVSFAALEKGVLVSSSTGNISLDLMTVAGNPWSLTVGVSTIDRQLAGTLTLDNGKTIIGWSLLPGRALLNLSLVYNVTLTGCNSPALLSKSTNNAIVICSEEPRINNQISTVIESTVTGAIFISTYKREEYRIHRVTIKLIDAPTVINYAKSTIDPKATIKFRQTFLGRGAKCAPQIP